jgi:hypothetical protein
MSTTSSTTTTTVALIESQFSPDAMTDWTQGDITVSDSGHFSVNPGYYAFNSNITGAYALAATGSGVFWLEIDFGLGNTYKMYKYSLVCVADSQYVDRAPKDWTVKGSNNGSDWDVIDTITGQTAWGVGEKREFICDTYTTAYRYFKFDCTADNDYDIYTIIYYWQMYELI